MKLSRVVAVRNLVVGSLAEQSRARQSTVQVVFEKLRDISTQRVHSSVTTKEEEKVQVSSNKDFKAINRLK